MSLCKECRRERRGYIEIKDGYEVVKTAFPEGMPGGPQKNFQRFLQEHGGDLRGAAEELLYEELPEKAGLEVADSVALDDVIDGLKKRGHELGVKTSRRGTLCASCRQKEAQRKILYEIVDKNDVQELMRDLNEPMKDKVMDIVMEFNDRLQPDKNTERALNRFSNLVEGSLPSSDATANQIRKVADELGLDFY